MSSASSPGSPGWGVGTKAVSPGAPSHGGDRQGRPGEEPCPTVRTHCLGLPAQDSRPFQAGKPWEPAGVPRLPRLVRAVRAAGNGGDGPARRPLLSSPEQQGRMKRAPSTAPFLPRGDPPCCALSPKESSLPAGLSQTLAAGIQMDTAPQSCQASLQPR